MWLRKIIWLCLWILSLVGISFYGGAVSYGLFFALTLLPVISVIYLLCVFFRFKIYQEIESRAVVCGQPTPYYFTLRNEDRFGFAGVRVRMFPDFSEVKEVSEMTEYELLPGDEFTYHTTITCKYSGEYEIGVMEAVVTDFFRVFHFRYRITGAIKAIVRPRVTELTYLRAMPDVVTVVSKEAYGMQTEPDVLVRDYVSGDSLRRIHWKATASEGQLKVRMDTGEQKQGVCVFMDTARYSALQADYIPLESKMLETVLALGRFFAGNRIPVTVCYRQDDIRMQELFGLEGYQDFYGRISAIRFQKDRKVSELPATLQMQNIGLHSKALIGVVHQVDDVLMKALSVYEQSGCMILLYVISNEAPEEYMRHNTSRRRVFPVPVEADLKEVL